MTARFSVRLTPRAGKDAITGWEGETLRARVSSAPVDGKANDALLRLLAKTLRVPASRITIVIGASGRTKVIEVDGISLDEIRARIA
ncbi:MAG: DUF167 domain-containing protein [Chloroflexi bacterium]|nr:DUF167 domain-containing protein [Chloroflexota bacterium]